MSSHSSPELDARRDAQGAPGQNRPSGRATGWGVLAGGATLLAAIIGIAVILVTVTD